MITELVLLTLVMLDESGMLDRFVDAILYGDERKKKGKGGEELEPKGMFKNNIYLLHTTQHSGINQTVCLAIIQCQGEPLAGRT